MTTEMPAPILQGASTPANADEAAVFEMFNKAKADVSGNQPLDQEEHVAPPPKPAAKESKTEEVKEQKIPDFILKGPQAKKEEPAVDEDEQLLSSRPEGQIKHDHFAKVQEAAKRKIEKIMSERQGDLKRIAEYEEKIKTSTVSAEAQAKYEAAQKRLEEQESILAKVAYAETPQFREKFTAREEALQGQITSTLKDFSIGEDEAQRLIQMSPKRRFEALDAMEMPESARSAVAALLVNHDALASDKRAALADSRKAMEAYRAEQEQAGKAQNERRVAEERRVFEEVSKRVADVYEPLMHIDGNEDWNKGVQTRREEAMKFLHGEKTWEELCEVVQYGVGAKFQHDSIVAPLRAEVARQAKLLEKLQRGGPQAQSHNGSSKTPERKMTDDERAKNTFNEQKALLGNVQWHP